jgi:hypothetical protein
LGDARLVTGNCEKGLEFPGFDLIHVAPYPGLSRFNGADKRMVIFVEVFGGVLVLRRIATTDTPAGKTKAQMDPCIARLHALFTNMLAGRLDFDLIQMGASVMHFASPKLTSGVK